MPRLLIVAATLPELAALIERLEGGHDLELSFGTAVAGRLAGLPVALAWFGVGKSSTAAGVALAIERLRPQTVVQLGIGGAFEGSGLEVGGAAVARSELHLDLGVAGSHAEHGEDRADGTKRATSGDSEDGAADDSFSDLAELGLLALERPAPLHNEIPVDEDLAEALAGDAVPLLPFGTAETVTGTKRGGRRLFRRAGVAVESMEGAAAAQTCFALGVPFGEVRGLSNLVGERDKAKWDVPAALDAAHTVLLDWLRAGTPRVNGSERARR